MLSEMRDEELVERYLAGEEAAFNVLYTQRYAVAVTNAGRRAGLDLEDAVGLADEVLTEAVKGFDHAYGTKFTTFMWRVWNFRLGDELRTGPIGRPGGMKGFNVRTEEGLLCVRTVRQGLTQWEDQEPAGVEERDIADAIASNDFMRWVDGKIRLAILAGPAPDRRLAVWIETLRDWHQVPYWIDAEIAQLFGRDPATVSRDRKFLDNLLNDFARLAVDDVDAVTPNDPKEESDDPDTR